MEKAVFLEKLKELVASEEILAVNNEVNELKSKFQDFLIEEERKRQVAILEEEGAEDFGPAPDPLKDEFFQFFSEYKAKKTAFQSALKIEQEANLRLKKKLIERLQTLISEEENIGVAVSTYKEIHEEWKKVGDIPRDIRQDIQNEYSKLLESFFHNLKIYRELKDHDLKRNSQLKRELIQKVVSLKELTSIKEVESVIKTLQNEFDEIGPVVNEDWEEIKLNYWDAVKQIYAKINDYYEDKRQHLQENIDKKKSLLEEVILFSSSIQELPTIKAWEEKTQELLIFQNKWKEIGFGTKKENEELWQAFREQCNLFFEKKRVFFDGLREANQKVVDLKRKFIDKANTLKESTDWKETTNVFLKLQQDWKNAGNAGQKLEQQLWKEFRTACDHFFNAKQAFFNEADKLNETNLVAKKEVIEQLEAYQPGEDKRKTLEDLRNFSAAFNAIGKVPMKDKDAIYEAYKKALDSHYTHLKLEGEEKEKAFFQAKMDSLKANPNSEKLLEKERKDMQQHIANLRQEINQFENNLGFFANSKGADALKKEVENKIVAAKRKIEEYQRKIKLLVNE